MRDPKSVVNVGRSQRLHFNPIEKAFFKLKALL
jgi:hypothetical protein